MPQATFDTLAAARKLEHAGMDVKQAEGVATKADLAELKAALTWRMFLVVGGLLALATALDRLLA